MSDKRRRTITRNPKRGSAGHHGYYALHRLQINPVFGVTITPTQA